MKFNNPSAILVNSSTIYLGDSSKLFKMDTQSEMVTLFCNKTYSSISAIYLNPYSDTLVLFDSKLFIIDRIYLNGTVET